MTTTGTIFKSGNSYAVRIPKNQITLHNLSAGDEVDVSLAKKIQEFDSKKFIKAVQDLQASGGAYHDIKDPVAWQREIRKDRPLPGRD